MNNKPPSKGIEFDFRFGKSSLPAKSPEAPFKILVAGGFSGGWQNSPGTGAGQRRPWRVNQENLDQRLRQIECKLDLPLGQQPDASLRLDFTRMDDFHPDALYQRIELFQRLAHIRARLQNPSTFAAGAQELQSLFAGGDEARQPSLPPPGEKPAAEAPASDQNDLVQRLFGRPLTAAEPAVANPVSTIADSLIKQIVAPHVVPKADPQLRPLLALLTTVETNMMRCILHHPRFQALEAAWRGIDFLVRTIESDEGMEVCLVDLSPEELGTWLNAGEAHFEQNLNRLVWGPAADGRNGSPWSLIVGNYSFEASLQDVVILTHWAKLAQAAGIPFLASASAGLKAAAVQSLWGDPQAARLWQNLRQSPEASAAGLAHPRFLLRLPYGKRTNPVDEFAFEEISESPLPSQYLWGNGAFFCASLVAQALSEEGGTFDAADPGGMSGLPQHVFGGDDEAITTGPAEFIINDKAMDQLLDSGLAPLLAIRGADRLCCPRLPSIASPARLLSMRGNG